MPKISVLIPCFNAQETLHQTFRMLDAQTFRDWEAICIDDGSTDATPHILAKAANADGRIRVFRRANHGPARTRNVATEIARGPLLAFLDADDVWHPERLQQVAERFAAPDAPDAVFGQTVFFRDNPDRPIAASAVPGHALGVQDLLGENPVCTMSNLSVRADVFARTNGFETTMRHAEDLEWLIRLAGTGARIVGEPAIQTHYRASPGGLSANLDAMHCGWRTAVRTALSVDPKITRARLRTAEAAHLRYLGRRALRMQAPASVTQRLVLRALRASPRGFFSSPRRGLLLLGAALIVPFLPHAIRRVAF